MREPVQILQQLRGRLEDGPLDQPHEQHEGRNHRGGNQAQAEIHPVVAARSRFPGSPCGIPGDLVGRLGQQFGGSPVDAGNRLVADLAVEMAVLECLQSLAVGGAHLLMRSDELLQQLQRLGLPAQPLFEHLRSLVHFLLLRLEIAPVLVQRCRVAAAQQGILPFLHLYLEVELHQADHFFVLLVCCDFGGKTVNTVPCQPESEQGCGEHQCRTGAGDK